MALAAALASIVNAVDPSRIILGGGITASAGEALFGPLRACMHDVEWRPDGTPVEIVAAQLGDEAGAIGAAKLAMDSLPLGVKGRMNVTERYLAECERLIATVGAQQDAIRQAAAWFAETILAGRMVHVFASGHSRIMVEEMWPRYGSFPGFHPIVELSLTFHNMVVGANGQRQAMFIENVSGPGRAHPAQLRDLAPGLGAGDQLERLQRRADRNRRSLPAQRRARRLDRQPASQRSAARAVMRQARSCRISPTSCSTPARLPAMRW